MQNRTTYNLTQNELEAVLTLLPTLADADKRELLVELERYEKAVEREIAQTSFLTFVQRMWPEFISGRHHKIMADAFERVARGECKRLIINMPPRHAVEVGMQIPTTAGFKTMAGLQIGDHVFGPDGRPACVLGKSEVFRDRDLYRVWADDGAFLDVDGEHLWTVRLDRKHNIYKDYTTEQLWRRQNGEVLRTKRGGGTEFLRKTMDPAGVRLPRLPDVQPVHYPPAELPVDPYVLGVWLGDGTHHCGVITAHDDDAVFIRAEIERRGYETSDQVTPMTFGVLGLKVALRSIGVLENKHIPPAYLTASETQRRDLLKGLMDTDGNVTKGGQCFFAQSTKALCVQVQQLVHSLGIKASLLESRATLNGRDYGPTWKVAFYGSDIAMLPRKEARTKKTSRAFGRYIRVEKLPVTGDTQCIRVDREDGLFLAGDGYICTHNTKSEFASYLLPAWFLGRFPGKKVIQTSNTAELAVGFGRKVRNLVDEEKYRDIFPELVLAADSKAAGRWNTSRGGDYFAIGVGGTVTGKGADLFIIDDPHSEQEAAMAESNPEIYDRVYEWYTSGPRQRLQPGGAIVVVMCMVGDTDVLMADGTTVKLKDIRPGDRVATYEDGGITTATVTNWQSNGVDEVFTVQTQSGKFLCANERHPFLVEIDGERRWIRLKDLKPGMSLVSTRDATGHLDLKQNPVCVTLDVITSITPSGRKEVFDVEIEHTENFIANGVVSHNTRWSKRDLTAQVLKAAAQRGGEEWEVIDFPAIMPSGKPLWPEFWPLPELELLKKELPYPKWMAQYMQNPTSDVSAIIKREWWQIWEKDDPPPCEFILMSWDTAFEKHNRADYSACTVWGVFYKNDDGYDPETHRDEKGLPQAHLILLNAFRDRLEFPELKRVVLREYKEWQPDGLIIEKKASGAPLIYELRAMGVPVQDFTPTKGNDKISRLNAVSDIFASGRVWVPETSWAEEVIEEVASFPAGDHDDYVDSVSMALARFRKGGYIRSILDEPDDDLGFLRRKHNQKPYY